MVFPLYTSVSNNSDVQLNFGPMNGLGTTTSSETNSGKTLVYSYDGPLNYRGMDLTLRLKMNVLKTQSELRIQYTITIPGHVNEASHSLVLRK